MHVFEKLLAVEFPNLPEPLRAVHLMKPVRAVAVEPEGSAFRLVEPAELDHPAPQALVPKLGLKSWGDSGALGVIYEGVTVRTLVETLLKNPTEPQRIAARAWVETGTPLKLYLIPYLDFSQTAEARFLANPDGCHRISACLRGPSRERPESVLPKMMAFAKSLCEHLPPRSHILEVAYPPNGAPALIEVNPGLTPHDLRTLAEGA